MKKLFPVGSINVRGCLGVRPSSNEAEMASSIDNARAPISVVVTTYDDGVMMLDALRSVVTQTVLPEEIIVVDDGSDSGIAKDLVECFRNETNVKVSFFRQDNAGPSAARNAGLNRASQDFVAFLDADDYWLPDHLEHKFAKLKERDPHYSTAYNGFDEFDGVSGRLIPTIQTGDYDGPISGAGLGVPGGVPAGMPFLLHRRATLIDVGGFDESLRVNEDFDLLLRLGRAGYSITGSGRPTVRRRIHDRSHTSIDPTRTIADLERFLEKAEREKLLPSAMIASKRKWAWLGLGKKLVRTGRMSDVSQGVDCFRRAFAYDRPQGFLQYCLYILTFAPPVLAIGLFLYRRSRVLLGD